MANKVKVKRTYAAGVVPTAAELGPHEFAVNWTDGIVYVKGPDGTIQSVTLGGSGGGGSYSLPTASSSVLGGIKVGSGLAISSGVLSATGGGGTANIVEATTAAGFPATGSAGTLYHATDVRRIYFWDATGSVYVEAGPSGGGGSGGDGTDSVLRALFLPPAPTSVTASAGNAQATLSWTAPTGVISQAPVTDYVVQFSSNSGSTWTTFADGTSTAASATVTGLSNGTAYVFRVAAVNGVGTGAYSSATSSVVPGDVFRAIPTMTSNTAPSGEVSGEANQEANEILWRAFDGNPSTFVNLARGPSNNPKRRLQYAFPEGQKSRISGYSMTLEDINAEAIPRDWRLYGSDDLSNWTLLETRNDTQVTFGVWFGTSIAVGEERSFTLPSVANYRAYRWVFYETVDGAGGQRPRQISLLP